MAGANKTGPSGASVQDFIKGQEPAERVKECRKLHALMRRATGKKSAMWGDSMVGFGQYYYKYASGREGHHFRTGFSPRKKDITVYIMPGFKKHEKLLRKLGPHKHSVSCLYIKRLSDIDLNVLEQLVSASMQQMADIYPHDKKPKSKTSKV